MTNPINLPSQYRDAIKSELINNHDAAPINRVLADPDVTLEEMKTLTPDEKAKFRAAIAAQKSVIGEATHASLEALLVESEKTLSSGVSPTVASIPTVPVAGPKGVPREISDAAGYARTSVSAAFKNPGEAGYQEYLSGIRRGMGKLPGYEPSSQSDIGDAIYQSRESNLKFIEWLEGEATKNTNSFDTSAKGSGMWSFVGEKTTFDSVEEKQKVIKSMLVGLGDALKKPEVQAGWIESFLGDGFIKTAVITVGGTVLAGVAAGVLLWKGGTWVLGKALGATGVAIAGAIGSMVGKGVNLGAKGVKAGAAAAAGAVRNHGTATPGAAPTSGPIATPTRELDLSKNFDRMVHENIVREMHMQANGGAIPTSAQIKDLAEDIKNGTASASEIGEYNKRVARYVELGDRPVGDAKKMTQYDSQVERVIKGEKDPHKWNLVEKSRLNGAAPVNATAMTARLRQTILDAKTDKFTVGANTFDINPAAKVPLEDIRSIEEQIKIQEGEIVTLNDAKKKLSARLTDEKIFAQAQYDLKSIDAKIIAAKADYDTTQTTAETQKSIHGELSTEYKTAKADVVAKEADWNELKEQKKEDKAIKKSLEEKYKHNIDRGLVVDSTGKLTDSKTMQKLESITATDTGVKEKIRLAEGEIARLNGELNARMATLNGINSKVPNAWNKAGIDVVLPDGTRVRVSQLSALLEALAKAMVKK